MESNETKSSALDTYYFKLSPGNGRPAETSLCCNHYFV